MVNVRAFVSCGRCPPVSLSRAICQQTGHAVSGKRFGFPFGFPSFPVSTLGVLEWKRASRLPGKGIVPAILFKPAFHHGPLCQLGNLALGNVHFLGNLRCARYAVFNQLPEDLPGGQFFPTHAGAGFAFGQMEMPFQRRSIGFRGIAVFDKPRHKLCPVLNFPDVFGFRQLNDPKGRVFPA